MKNIHRQLLDYLRSNERCVLATVVRTSGSTPQKPGSSALFGEAGLLAGTVGGGSLEAEVQEIAKHVMISGASGLYFFNLDEGEEGEGAICGGEAEVLIDADPIKSRPVLEMLEKELSTGGSGHLVTLVPHHPGEARNIQRYWVPSATTRRIPEGMEEVIWKEIHPRLVSSAGEAFTDVSPTGEHGPAPWIAYMESIRPLPKLVIAGGGHVGKALAHLGALLDFEVTVIDDREAFACRENIPDADYFMHGDIASSMQSVNPGPDHYIVIVTRGHLRDSEALRACIGSPAAYVGMIGSRHKVAVMKEKFLEAGWATTEQWAKVHTPIGLPIGSKTVQEIAVSIAAELVQARDQNRPKHAP